MTRRSLLAMLLLVVLAPVALAQDALEARYKKSTKLGEGSYKYVYAIDGRPDLVLGILKAGRKPDVLEKENVWLKQLDAKGVPVAKILEMGTYQGKRAYVMKRYVFSDRDERWFYESWRYLNENSIADAEKIEKALLDAKLDVLDFQYLLAADGHVVVNDPLGVEKLVGPEIKGHGTLRALKMDARAAIALKKAMDLASRTEDAQRDAEIKDYFARPILEWLAVEQDPREAKVRDAVLRYLERGPTTERAKEVAAAVRSGKLVVRFCPVFEKPPAKNELRLLATDHFTAVAASLVREGSKKLHPEGGLEVGASAQVVAFLDVKGLPDGLGDDPVAKRHGELAKNPTELVRVLEGRDVKLTDGERARLALKARGAIEVAKPRAEGGLIDRLDRIKERDREKDKVHVR